MLWVEGLPRRSGEPSSRSSSLGVVRRLERDVVGCRSERKQGNWLECAEGDSHERCTMQHLDDVLDHLSRLRGHLEPCVEGVYGLVAKTLRREGCKVSIWLENNLIIAVSYSFKDMSIVRGVSA